MYELKNVVSSFMLIAPGNVNAAQCENIIDILIHGYFNSRSVCLVDKWMR